MKIFGFQKMTLLDFPGKVACTVFTGGCNFRCPFCHNAPLVTELDLNSEIKEKEVTDYLLKRTGLLDGVCITGGEPLLQPDIEDFIAKIKEMGYAVKLDTNGSYPERLKSIIHKGLVDYVAMDIKNCKEKYALTVGIDNFDITPIEQSVEILLENKVDYEFRTTVVKEYHTVEDIKNAALWIKGAKRYFLQNFVDSGELIGSNLNAVSKETLEKMKKEAEQYTDFSQIRGI